MTVATLAAALIRSFEGCKLAAYWDATGKKWTIGFGHTLNVKQHDTCTMEQAAEWLAQDCAPLFQDVAGLSLIEAAALVSFGYNCGQLPLHWIEIGEITISDERFWFGDKPYGETSGGQHLPGLEARRHLEASLIEASRQSQT
jgi:GH24 family phage-related lysozyme (muramidase)